MIKPDKLVLAKRKTLTLKIDKNGKLIVLAPKNMPLENIFKFIQEKENWIIKKQTEITSTKNLNNDLFNYNSILFLGKKYEVVFIKNQKEVVLTNNALCVPYNYCLSTEKLSKSLKKWYILNANQILIERFNAINKVIKLNFNNLSIINSRAKWGMCDNKKNLYLNYKLIMLSHDLIDYVIVHELMHLIELNHSKNFWAEVKKILPDYKDRQKLLKKCNFILDFFV